jgi:P-type Ca2+ transporter type 2C
VPLDGLILPRDLTSAEALQRLAADGPNALARSAPRGPLALTAHVLREPMFLLLIATSAIYLLLGDLREALVLAASIGVIATVTVVQERRTERTLERLRDLASPRALVVRDGKPCRIAGRDVVRGDLLVLGEGDRVAADARLVESRNLRIDESLLTGESLPTDKMVAAEGAQGVVHAGTLVVGGSARAQVIATGERSQLGRIGRSLATLESGKTSLEIETARVVRVIALAAIGVCMLVALLYFATRGDALGGALAGLTLAMALVPEEFPIVLTVFLALGAWRIAKQGVLTRRLPAIEMLGAATVLCCDKTGTLTENRMRVAQAWSAGRWRGLDEADPGVGALLATAGLACETDPFDPMDRAIVQATERFARDAHPVDATLERWYPLAPGFLAVAHGWRLASGRLHAAMKGAPETVLPLCRLAPDAFAQASGAASEAAARGMRLLAVAEARASAWHDDAREYEWHFLGFVALADPLRPTVPAAIALCRGAGIRVVMVTGDHPETAREIARQAGIDTANAMTGTALDAMDDAALAKVIARVQVFARVRPEQKLRLVKALQAAGEIVAMTGDGVNDAPALKAANIGIAMGKRGTDVAREAAAVVLIDDDFTSIVHTARLGRRIYDNIRNAMRYLVSVHVPLAGIGFIPVAAGWPLVLSPVHVLFLEFMIDPACSIAFESERAAEHIMDRPPRPAGVRLFTRQSLATAILLGLAVLAAVVLVHAWASASARGEAAARTLAFATLVCGNVALIFANRSRRLTALELATRENLALWIIAASAIAALLVAIYSPGAAALFRFAALDAGDLAVAAAAGFASVAWYAPFRRAGRGGARAA